jgi:N-acetylglutamate synthase-like GNAT family acetyltransferase
MVGYQDRPEHGFIMEFYILPEYRRRGYGKIIYQRIETLFVEHGVEQIYLFSNSFAGMPFFESLGFKNADVKERIYEKALT